MHGFGDLPREAGEPRPTRSDENGRPLALQIGARLPELHHVAEPMTERRNAREQQSIVALDLLPAPVIVIGARGTLDFVNSAARALLSAVPGAEPSPGRAVAEALPWLAQEVARGLASPEPETTFEKELILGDSPRAFLVTFRRLDAVGGALLLLQDITALRAIDQELRKSAELSRTLLASLPQRIFFKSVDGIFLSVNEPFAADFGLRPEELIGKSDYDLFPEDLAEKYRADDRRVIESRRPETIVETNLVPGGWRYVEVVKTPVIQADGRPMGVLGIFTDITERVRQEEELKRTAEELARSNEELASFAYVASHDLQEPLRMVSSYTQLLARRYADRLDDDAREFIRFAVDGATRMQQLINDLLEYSRVGTRTRPFEPTSFELILDRVLCNLSVAISEAGATVTRDPLPTVMADPTQMVQLFQNLIGNAIKFRGEQPPRVHVSARQEGGEWIFSVRDNGIGIDPSYFERIFVIFQRLHGRSEYPGTGIGLAICKKIVQRHGGRIWVESAPGEGACFSFSLPASPEAAPHPT